MKPEWESMRFEELLDALEAMTRRLASGELGIEEAAALYEEAGELHALASQRLATVQERIERLQTGAAVHDEEAGA